jgi:hypothetical protein
MTGGTGNSIYSVGVSYFPNSDLNESYDSVNGSWKYTYDDFNRLNTAVSNTGMGCAEVYDRFGNRLQQNTYTGTCMTPQYTLQGNTYWIAGFSYDAAGNMIGDGIHLYGSRTLTYGEPKEIVEGATITLPLKVEYRSGSTLEAAPTVEFILGVVGPIAINLASNFIYDKLKAGKGLTKLTINRRTTELDAGEIRRVIEEEIKLERHD